MNWTQKPDIELTNNTTERLACALVLDCSASMRGRSIEQLNDGVRALDADLKGDEAAVNRVDLTIMRCGGTVSVATDWVGAAQFEPPAFQADGLTPLGEAMRLALGRLEERKRQYRDHGIDYKRPWIFCISDGEPTDDGWEEAADACRNAEAEGKVTIFMIGVEGARMDKLGRFCARPPKALADGRFKDLFVWLSRSMRAGSRAAPSEVGKTPLPSTDPWSVA